MMFELLLGHLAGDYLLQNEWMAMNKSKNTGEGWLAAFVHCFIYTWVICLFTWTFDWYWFVAVFCSHFFIDKFKLAEYYMHYIKGKGMKDYVAKDNIKSTEKTWEKPNLNRYDMLEGGFTSLVYSVTDNTMHLILMFFAYKLIY